MKKIILILVVAFCCCAQNKTIAQIVDNGVTGDCSWTLTGAYPYTLTISGTGSMGDYSSTEAPWISYSKGLETVIIQQGVTSIGEKAFDGCVVLRSVTIPNSVTSIGEKAFSDCSNLTSVSIPNSVISIGENAFSDCNGLTSIIIPNSVISIGVGAFLGCNNLISITVDANNSNYSSVNGVLFSKLQDILIQYPASKTGNYIIPNSVISIEDHAFRSCSTLTSVTIGSSVTTIGIGVFFDCNDLTSVTIGSSVTSIGMGAFVGCNNLTSITVDANNSNYSSVNGVLFSKLQDILIQYPAGKTGNYIIPNSVTTIGDYAFSYCYDLTSVTIGNSVTTIGDHAFNDCNGLTSVTIPNSVTSIGENVFHRCRYLTSATIGNSVTTIGTYTFAGCYSLVSVTIGNSVTTIGNYAFDYCSSLTSITIPNSVTTIGESAFRSCGDLASITIGNSVTSIEDYAFSYCNDLTEIYVKAVTPPLIGGANVFYNLSTSIAVHIPCGSSVTAYQSAYGWSRFTNITGDISVLDITVLSNDDIMGIVNITRMNTCTNDTAVITAIANQGYRFVEWNDGNTENPRTVIVTQNVSYTAEFEAMIYHVTVSSNDDVMGSVTGDGDYPANSVVIIEAIPNIGYRFVQWQDGNTENPRTITVTQDVSYTAVFNVMIYHVTVIANNDVMGIVTGDGDYPANTAVIIEAIPNTGYRFVQWQDGNTENPRTLTVTQDISFTALFATASQGMYHVFVTVNNSDMGRVTGDGDYPANSVVTIEAIPNIGYRFIQWADGNTQNPRTITVTQDMSFTAIFNVATAIKDIEASVITVYPNPATDNIHIALAENVHQAVFTLYDMQGKALIEQNISHQDMVSVSNLAVGIYIYNVRTDKQSYTGKLVISD